MTTPLTSALSVFASRNTLRTATSVRASSVVRLFVENGIDAQRLTAVGHGSNHPVGSNDTAEGRVRNRRVEVLILATLPDTVTEVPVNKPEK